MEEIMEEIMEEFMEEIMEEIINNNNKFTNIWIEGYVADR
jgi:hypothetical protein